ncbi:ankyrin repeat-containing domain protein [Phakopsora pachyrhizi]|uniref:Ankyrin repeat-containing domain protein n=1 Tax=Phakopsora pachyrhizi TaxID=170000 RepID=A0AAV0BKP3_PHAPC|nr:ankyrin repeat-containing domain protein [Phakopsora pachyrhizi]
MKVLSEVIFYYQTYVNVSRHSCLNQLLPFGFFFFQGQAQLVSAALSEKPSKVNSLDADGRSPLHNACSSGSLSVVRVLLEHQEPKCDLELPDSMGWTALIIAASAGITEVVSELIHAGANVNATNEKGHSNLCPRHYAASKGRTEIGAMLIRYGADINAKDRANQQPLHRAASSGATPFIKLLLQPRLKSDGEPDTETPKLKLNQLDRAGHTPLHLALESGHAEAACILIEAGADRGRLDFDGKRPEELTDVLGDQERRRVLQYIESRCGKYH